MEKQERTSNIELYRIILMTLIIAHHYTVNSGLKELYDFNNVTGNMIFLQVISMFGKTVINCFSIITGYFMVKSHITVRKFAITYMQVKFYYLFFFVAFLITGYTTFSAKALIKTIFNIIYEAGDYYTGTYIVFFLLIPFINIMIKGLNRHMYRLLLVVLICYFTIFSTIFGHDTFDFLGWMVSCYLIGGYIRLYFKQDVSYSKVGIIGTVISIILMASSIVVVDLFGSKMGFTDYNYLIVDSHKVLAIVCAVFSFLVFKELKIRQNKIINYISSATFGILLFHTNSDAMRKFLWATVFKNTYYYESDFLPLHMIVVVLIVFLCGLCFESLRKRFIERPILKMLDKKHIFETIESRLVREGRMIK